MCVRSFFSNYQFFGNTKKHFSQQKKLPKMSDFWLPPLGSGREERAKERIFPVGFETPVHEFASCIPLCFEYLILRVLLFLRCPYCFFMRECRVAPEQLPNMTCHDTMKENFVCAFVLAVYSQQTQEGKWSKIYKIMQNYPKQFRTDSKTFACFQLTFGRPN